MEKGVAMDAVLSVPVSDDDVRVIKGSYDGTGVRVAIIVARFNEELTSALLQSAIATLKDCHVEAEDISVIWVPGAFEIPAIAEQLAQMERHDAVIALGTVIQGETQHAQLINQHVALSLGQLSASYAMPVIYEVISAQTMDQAKARCLGEDSKGRYAALAALEMVHVFEQLDESIG